MADDDRLVLIRRAHQREIDRRARRFEGRYSRPLRDEWYERLCKWCGKEYNAKYEGDRYYCSSECARTMLRVLAEERDRLHNERKRAKAGRSKSRRARRSPA